MDLIKNVLQQLKKGHVTTISGIVVMRRADTFVCGETINIRSTGVDIDEASRQVYELSKR